MCSPGWKSISEPPKQRAGAPSGAPARIFYALADLRRRKENLVSEHTTAAKMRRKPKYMKGVGLSSVKITETATPKGASSASSTAAEDGSEYFWPMFWNSRARVVAAAAS